MLRIRSVLSSPTAQERLSRSVRALLDFSRRTQADLALALGYTQGHISMLLNGQRPWQIRDLDTIAEFFSVPVPALFHEGQGAQDRRSGRDRRSGYDRRHGVRDAPPRSPGDTEDDYEVY